MILRKPYAILIKNFKLIHTIITICMIYLVYRSYLIFDYIAQFMRTDMIAAREDLTSTLFSNLMFILPGIIIVLLAILLVVMVKKKKPWKFYVVNIIIYIITIAMYSYLYDTISYIETNIISAQSIKLAHDAALLLLGFQIVSMILSFIRAVGFDIKKFDFGKDLVELEINEEDNEEFEVEVNVETNVIKRGINRHKRFIRYVYLENRFLINMITLILIAVISYVMYLNLNIYNVVYKEGDTFYASTFEMGITKSFITSNNYRNIQITDDDKTLVVLELYINGLVRGQTLNTAKTELVVDNIKYFPNKIEYRYSLFDLGSVYYNEIIPMEFEKVLLVYEIPKSDLNKSMQYRYINDLELADRGLNPKYIRVSLDPYNLDDDSESEELELGKDVILNEKVMDESTFVINSFDIKKTFEFNYNYCISTDECYQSKEYLKANLNTNYDKVLLKLDTVLTLDEDISISNIYNARNLINYFGTLTYKYDGKTYTVNGDFSTVSATHIDNKSNYYFEVNENILNAEDIVLRINIRNREYKYTIQLN